jgi:hypothetical protein
MEEFPTRPIEMCGDSTLEWVEDNSSALKYRDASCQKGEHRSKARRVPGLRWRLPSLPRGCCFARGRYPRERSRYRRPLEALRRSASKNRRVQRLPRWPRLFAAQPIHAEPLPSVWRCRRKSGEFRQLSVAGEGLAQASRWGTWKIDVAINPLSPTRRINAPRTIRDAKTGGSATTLLGRLQFNDSALHSDRDGVRSVACAKLRENVPDVELNCLLGNRELIGDQFVCIPAGN